MEKEQEIVAKKIESGEYFADANSWFHAKFTRPRTEAAYVFIICVIAVAAVLVGIAAFSRIFPLSPGFNFVVGRPITAEENITIRKLAGPRDSANNAVMKFMLNEYTVAREEYIEEKLDRNFRLVYSFSDDQVNNEFMAETSLSNPDNPIIKYGKLAKREIKVNSISLVDINGKPATDENVSSALVYYTSILTFADKEQTQEITRHEADITFKYNLIVVDQETGLVAEKPEMVVTSYKTRLLQ